MSNRELTDEVAQPLITDRAERALAETLGAPREAFAELVKSLREGLGLEDATPVLEAIRQKVNPSE